MTVHDKVLSHYAETSWFTRRHIATRLKLCPFQEIAERLPDEGPILDIGCGHGHFLWYLKYLKSITSLYGCDIDGDKINIARRGCVEGDSNPVFETGTPQQLFDNKQFTGMAILDILYLMDRSSQDQLLAYCVEHLQLGGSLVIKALDTRKGWKTKKALLQEWIMVSLLGKTKREGDSFEIMTPEETVDKLSEKGLDTQLIELKTMNPSVLIQAVKNS